jgi:acyl-CoA synthetase (AMP-forming)/AMP-acid ligase II
MTLPPSDLPRLDDYIAWHAAGDPARPALIHDGRTISYAALEQAVDATARALLASGVRRGDRVATLSPPHPDFVVQFLAAASIGTIWLGLNPRYRAAELAYVAGDAKPTVLLARSAIGDRRYDDEIEIMRQAAPSLRCIVSLGDDQPAANDTVPFQSWLEAGAAIRDLTSARNAVGGRDACLIVYTSGSTGRPKGALLHHSAIANFSRTQNRVWPIDPYRVINYFPINHIGSVVDCTMPCLLAGGTMICQEQFDAAACLELMQRHGVTLWGSVPSVFQLQLGLPGFAAYDLSAVQLIAWGGAAMPADLVARLTAICPRLATNYGMTETTSAITFIAPTSDTERLTQTVGCAFPGVEIRLCDSDDRPVADGATGEVQTRSAGNFLGYWQRPEDTDAAFTRDGFFRTGDLARYRADGTYQLVGRVKEMFKSGGYNVYPREIETVLEAHPSVAMAAVVAVPDPLWQEVGVAFVVLHDAVDEDLLAAHCRDRLAAYKIPKRIVIEQALPLLPIGKVDKRALAERAVAERA